MSFSNGNFSIIRGGGGGGGVLAFATVTEIIAASVAGLATGFYSVPSIGAVYWDTDLGTFSLGAGLDALELSPIMDHLADIKFWFGNQGRVTLDGLPAGIGDAVYYWNAHEKCPNPIVARPNSVVVQSLGGRPAKGGGMSLTNFLLGIDGPFEVFSTISLNTLQTNTGIFGTWNGSAGILFLPAHFSGSFGPSIGFGGVYAVSPDRIDGTTAPHVVSARYTGAELIITVDGVDKATVAKTGTLAATTVGVVIGAYEGGGVTAMNGKMADALWINKALTVDERAAIVDHLKAAIGI